MKRTLLYWLFAGCSYFASSCVSVHHYMYAPATPAAPMLNARGESCVKAMVSTGMHRQDTGYSNGYELQGAYAFTDHIAVTAGFSSRNEKDKYSHTPGWFGPAYSAGIWYKRRTTDIGLGYFTSIDSDDEVFFDLYGGYGFGRYHMHELGDQTGTYTDRYHSCSISKIYLQPGVHFNISDMSQASLGVRFSTLSYHNIKSDYTKEQEQSFGMYDLRNTVYTFLDPTFTVRLWVPHTPWIKLEMQASASCKLSNPGLDYRPITISAGLSFDLSKLHDRSNYRRKKKK
ncbi:MAG: outer membrane beta-barrel protein [Bacteroidetes bacterium]|nr:outer membrane beta-barrel protein [Bacteroidota bacterium]